LGVGFSRTRKGLAINKSQGAQVSWWKGILLIISSPLILGLIGLIGGNFVYELTGSTYAKNISCGVAATVRDIVPQPSLWAYEFETKFCKS
jgi:hypothetical protein